MDKQIRFDAAASARGDEAADCTQTFQSDLRRADSGAYFGGSFCAHRRTLVLVICELRDCLQRSRRVQPTRCAGKAGGDSVVLALRLVNRFVHIKGGIRYLFQIGVLTQALVEPGDSGCDCLSILQVDDAVRPIEGL